jgi:hypothetical protein
MKLFQSSSVCSETPIQGHELTDQTGSLSGKSNTSN